jgi:hypothetical protein
VPAMSSVGTGLAWVAPVNFDYGLPLPAPQATPGCHHCARLVGLRETAQKAGDGSAVTDVNVLMRRHSGEVHH